jgi:hypothetical protein
MDGEHYKITSLIAPRIRADGKAIEFQLKLENGSELTLHILTTDVHKLVEVVVKTYQAAKNRGTLLSESEDNMTRFEPTPWVVNVEQFGFLTEPSHDSGFLAVRPLDGSPEIQMRFSWPQLRRLVALIQQLDNIQTADLDSTEPS